MDIGALVEKLVGHGVPVAVASEVVAQAYTAGATSAPSRKKPAKGVQMTLSELPTDIPPPRKATRLPVGFSCDLAYAQQQGIPKAIAEREAEKFRNYWAARSGAGATKLDWPATWRNWCLSVAEKLGCAPRPPGATIPQIDPKKLTREQWAPIMAIYEKTSNWNPLYGPEPGLPGSLAPQRSML